MSKTIRQLREGRGLSQEALGEQVGVRQQAVANWERGVRQPRYRNLRKLADFFGVTIDEIALDYREDESA